MIVPQGSTTEPTQKERDAAACKGSVKVITVQGLAQYMGGEELGTRPGDYYLAAPRAPQALSPVPVDNQVDHGNVTASSSSPLAIVCRSGPAAEVPVDEAGRGSVTASSSSPAASRNAHVDHDVASTVTELGRTHGAKRKRYADDQGITAFCEQYLTSDNVLVLNALAALKSQLDLDVSPLPSGFNSSYGERRGDLRVKRQALMSRLLVELKKTDWAINEEGELKSNRTLNDKIMALRWMSSHPHVFNPPNAPLSQLPSFSLVRRPLALLCICVFPPLAPSLPHSCLFGSRQIAHCAVAQHFATFHFYCSEHKEFKMPNSRAIRRLASGRACAKNGSVTSISSSLQICSSDSCPCIAARPISEPKITLAKRECPAMPSSPAPATPPFCSP